MWQYWLVDQLGSRSCFSWAILYGRTVCCFGPVDLFSSQLPAYCKQQKIIHRIQGLHGQSKKNCMIINVLNGRIPCNSALENVIGIYWYDWTRKKTSCEIHWRSHSASRSLAERFAGATYYLTTEFNHLIVRRILVTLIFASTAFYTMN